MKSLALLLLTLNTSFAANNLLEFENAKSGLIEGVYEGVTSYTHGPCTASLKMEEDKIIASIDFLNWKKEPTTITLSFSPNEAEDLQFDPDLYGEEEQRTARLSKHKVIPEEGNDGFVLDIYKSVVQEIDAGGLKSLAIEAAIVNEHSDPSESRVECYINN